MPGRLVVVRRDVRPVQRLPDVEPYDDFRPSRWCHGGILQSVSRSEALPATPALPGRGARARQFPISRSERRAPPVATPPGPLRGRGRRPSGGARSAAPRGLPVSWAMHRMLVIEVHRWLTSDCNGGCRARSPVVSPVKGVVEWSVGLFPDARGAKVQVVRLNERSRHED